MGPGLAGLGAVQGTGAGGALGCLCLGVLAGLPVRRGEMLALGTGPWRPPSVLLPDEGSGGCGSRERTATSPRQLRMARAGWFWGAGVWWVQGREGTGGGVQLGSSTIWAVNASMRHTAVWEALHTRLHCVRSKVLRGLGEGAGGPTAPQEPYAAHPGLSTKARLWAELRVLGWPRAAERTSPLSCLLAQAVACKQSLSPGERAGSLSPQLGREDEVSCLVPTGLWRSGRTVCLPAFSWCLVVPSADRYL